MTSGVIYITGSDLKRLKELIIAYRASGREDEMHLEKLEKELNRGVIVDSKNIPNTVITMNSKVRVKDLDTEEEMTYWLVFPAYANPDNDRVSILSPIGTALLGYKIGDIIEWKVPAGLRRLKVEEVLYQPEAAGDYHL